MNGNWKDMIARYTSRKWLMGLSGPIVALIVHFWPDKQEQVATTVELVVDVLANLGALLTPIAFIMVEGKVDAKRIEMQGEKTIAAVENAPPSVATAVAKESMENPK